MDREFWATGCVVFAAAFGLMFVICALVLPPLYYFERRACYTRAHEMQLDWKYRFVGGCFVELPSGRYVNLDNIRFTEQGKILVEP